MQAAFRRQYIEPYDNFGSVGFGGDNLIRHLLLTIL